MRMTLRWFFLFFFFVRNVCLINWIFISIGQAYFKEIKYFLPLAKPESLKSKGNK